MSQHDTCDGDAEYARVGEVGQAKTAGLVLLTEDHILLGPDQRSPRAHAPLQRATNAGADLRWRRRISSSTAIARMPGADFRIGTISPSQTSPNGSGRRRPRGAFFCEGSRGSSSMR